MNDDRCLPRHKEDFDLIRRLPLTGDSSPRFFDVEEGGSTSQALTMTQFLRGAADLAARFARHDLTPTCRVALDLSNRTDFLQCLLAIWHIGAIPMLLHGRWTEAMKDEACSNFGCAIRVFRGEGALSVATCPASRVSPRQGLDLDAIALIFFTSGSTGRPSAVPVTFDNLICSMEQFRQELQLDRTRRVAALAPLYHAAGLLTMILPSLFLGASIIHFSSSSQARSDEALARQLAHHGVDTIFLVPTMWERLSRTEAFGEGLLSGFGTALTGGARTSHRLLERWREQGIELIVGYGMTETAPTGTFARVPLWRADPLSIGVAPDTLQLRLVDQDAHGVGRIAMKGENVMCGYLMRDEAADELCLDRSCFDDEGFLISKDLGAWREYRDAHGECTRHLIFLGRCDDRIISGGENISSLAVEAALEEVFPSLQWAVIGLEDDLWGECVTACASRGDQELPTLAELRRLLIERSTLASYMLPRQLHAVTQFPLGSSGKIDRRALRQSFCARHV